MPSTYSPNLRIELIATGEQSGTWGATTNNNLGTLIEQAISGYVSISITSASQALTALNGVDDQSRNMVIEFSSASTVATAFTVYTPPIEKFYIIRNNTAYSATISAATLANGTTPSGGTTVVIPSGKTVIVYCDVTNIREAINYATTMQIGTLTLTNPLSAASGGLPTQTGLAGLYLSTDGTNAFWGVTGIKTVAVATTANITLSAPQTIDGISVVAGNRVLVKNQTVASQNGIYVVAAGSWTRSADADSAAELAASIVNVQAGTTNGGTFFYTTFKSTDTLNTTAVNWILAVLPSQTSNTGKFLSTDGSSTVWSSPAAKTVLLATTANIASLSGLATTVDGVLVNTAGVRILVKNQTTASQNGIYVSASGAWTRAQDSATASDIAGSVVTVQAGTTNGGTQYATTFKSTDTLDTTSMTWNPVVTGTIVSGVTSFSAGTTGFTPSTGTSGAVTLAGTLKEANGGTNQSTYATGDLLYASAANTLSKRTIGTTGQVLTVSGGVPTWAAIPTSGTVTSVASGNGMNFTTITGTGTVTMGTPTTLTTSTTNAVTATSHTHAVTFPVTSVNFQTGAVITLNLATARSTPFSPSTSYTDFTSISSNATRITVTVSGLSTSGTSGWLVQIGNSGTPDNTGYLGAGGVGGTNWDGAANSTAGFFVRAVTAARVVHGSITLTRLDGNLWVASGVLAGSENNYIYTVAGSKQLAGVLNILRITTTNGTDTFDAGTVNILVEDGL